MIFLYLVGLIAYLFTWILSLLPGDDFLAIPAAGYSAIETVGGYLGWFLGLAGPSVKSTLLTIVPIIIGIKVATFLWHIIRFWRVPLISRFIQGKE